MIDVKKAMQDPEVISSFDKKGTLIIFKGSDEYGKYIDQTFTKWKKIAKNVGAYKRTD